jgi:hypothetical protein
MDASNRPAAGKAPARRKAGAERDWIDLDAPNMRAIAAA